jgi:hypothetical protein
MVSKLTGFELAPLPILMDQVSRTQYSLANKEIMQELNQQIAILRFTFSKPSPKPKPPRATVERMDANNYDLNEWRPIVETEGENTPFIMNGKLTSMTPIDLIPSTETFGTKVKQIQIVPSQQDNRLPIIEHARQFT